MTTSEFTSEQVKKRRSRWWQALLVTVVVIAVLAGAAELALRLIIPNVIAQTVRENMGLSSDEIVDVQLHGSALVPALVGRVGAVELTIPNIEVFDGIETTLYASADSMPFDPTTGNIVGAVASATIPSSSAGAVAALATNGLIDEGSIENGQLQLGRALEMFGFEVHMTAALAVSIEEGDLFIEPTAIDAAGFNLTTDQLRPMLGDVAASLLDTHVVCIRDQIPAGITLTNIELSSTGFEGTATVTAKLDADILSNPQKQQPGNCDAT